MEDNARSAATHAANLLGSVRSFPSGAKKDPPAREPAQDPVREAAKDQIREPVKDKVREPAKDEDGKPGDGKPARKPSREHSRDPASDPMWDPWHAGPHLRADSHTARQLVFLTPRAMHLESRSEMLGDFPPDWVEQNGLAWDQAVSKCVRRAGSAVGGAAPDPHRFSQRNVMRQRRLIDLELANQIAAEVSNEIRESSTRNERLRREMRRRRRQFVEDQLRQVQNTARQVGARITAHSAMNARERLAREAEEEEPRAEGRNSLSPQSTFNRSIFSTPNRSLSQLLADHNHNAEEAQDPSQAPSQASSQDPSQDPSQELSSQEPSSQDDLTSSESALDE